MAGKMKENEVVAKAIRMEIDPHDDSLYLVFKVTNVSFAKKVRENWLKDIPLNMIGKNLLEV
jgi:hypothetical protein